MADSYIKDPNAVLDYQWDWSAWLPDDDTIASATVTAESGLTVDSSSNADATVTAWLSGGTVGSDYNVTCRIVTADGRTDDRTIRIIVQDQ
jgi:hypothetical protein